MHFTKKSDVIDYVRKLIGKYSIGSFLDSEDAFFCSNLFTRHSHYLEKAGSGIKSIEVRRDEYGNKHFQIHRTDGTDIDISWVHCITPKGR
ncbi:DUF3223 domain-containing protein [Sphingomonas sp. NCPPB 2930]